MKRNKAETREFSRIIAPVDGSEGAAKAVQKALFLAKKTGKPIVALYIVDTPRLTDIIPADNLSVVWGGLLMKEGQKVLNDVKKRDQKWV
jgi:nucleotide-binding universal stress UspA family protein